MCFTHEYRLPFSANIEPLLEAYRLRLWRKYRFSQYPLIHRRRDDGPPSPQRLLRNRGKVGVGGESCRDDDRQARNSPTDGGECVGLLHTPEGGECVGLPQQVRAARRRVLYVRNCATVEHVVARRRAIRRQEHREAAAMLCPTRLFDSSGRTIFTDEREGYSSSRTSLAVSAIIAPAEPLVTLPKSKR